MKALKFICILFILTGCTSGSSKKSTTQKTDVTKENKTSKGCVKQTLDNVLNLSLQMNEMAIENKGADLLSFWNSNDIKWYPTNESVVVSAKTKEIFYTKNDPLKIESWYYGCPHQLDHNVTYMEYRCINKSGDTIIVRLFNEIVNKVYASISSKNQTILYKH